MHTKFPVENPSELEVGPEREPASNEPKLLRHRLPNEMEIAYQSRVELHHFYEDIFDKQVYLRHGIQLFEGDCVFDVGANIGLFTLFVSRSYRDIAVYSFEPAPPLFEILSANAKAYAPSARLFNCGLSNEPKQAAFTFYPNSSGMSSFYGDEEEEKEALRAIMFNQLRKGMDGMADVMKYADDILDERFKHQTFTCRLETLSNMIREHRVRQIDLLKIDVQKSELDVLLGIEQSDWQKIRQIVMEVHDLDGRLEQTLILLQSHGYRVTVEQDEMYEGSVLYNLYALRPSRATDARREDSESTSQTRFRQLRHRAQMQREALKRQEQWMQERKKKR
jgi:phthiocerol/phenolphthiocerol synthesis type-I polyketide synthase E